MKHFLDGTFSTDEVDDSDLAWTKPLFEEARAQIERGEFVTLEDHNKRMDQVLTKLRDR